MVLAPIDVPMGMCVPNEVTRSMFCLFCSLSCSLSFCQATVIEMAPKAIAMRQYLIKVHLHFIANCLSSQ